MRVSKLIPFIVAAGVSLVAAQARAGHVLQVDEPRWLHQPHQKDVATAYPAAALKAEVSGVTAIRCGVEADGHLSHCSVLAETPQDLGFGQAALKLVNEYQLRSDQTGAIRPGASIVVDVDFDLGDANGPPVLDIWPGDAAYLIRPLPPSSYVGGAQCPFQPDPAKRCEARFFRWQVRPGPQRTQDILASADQGDGRSQLDCAVGRGGALTDCRVKDATPAATRALLQLATQFRTEAKAYDGAPMSAGRVVVDVDWAMLRRLTAPIG